MPSASVRTFLAGTLLAMAVASHALGTLSVSLGQKGGWMPDGWGTLQFKLEDGDVHARLEKWSGHWVVNGVQKDAISDTWEGEGASRTTTGYLPKVLVDAAKPGFPKIVGTVTVFEGGGEREEPFSIDVPGAVLPEPLETRTATHVGLALQKSRWAAGSVAPAVLHMLDVAYGRMQDLTGVTPYDGKVIVLQESPPNPYWAYAGNPVILNGDFVSKTIKEASDGHLPFGWIHEMGHDFDVNGDWYIWSGPCAEFHANFKLGYVVEQPIPGFRMVWDGYSHAAYPIPGGKTDSDGYKFVDSFFLFFGDAYLADGTRKWDSLSSDEIHSFFQRLVRVYGWEPIKRWYRDYATYSKAGLKPPSDPVVKVALCCGLMSKETGVDLLPIFTRWRFPITAESVKAAMAAYPVNGN